MQKIFISRAVWVLLILLAGILVFAGCGYRVQAHAAVASPVLQKDPKKCGEIALNPAGGLLDEKSAAQKGGCFLEEYQHCQVAMLSFSRSGIDTIAMQTFLVVKKQSRCQVTDLVQYRVVPGPFRTQGLYSCAGVSKTKDELLIKNCGSEGTVIIPLSGDVSSIICVMNLAHDGLEKRVEACGFNV